MFGFSWAFSSNHRRAAGTDQCPSISRSSAELISFRAKLLHTLMRESLFTVSSQTNTLSVTLWKVGVSQNFQSSACDTAQRECDIFHTHAQTSAMTVMRRKWLRNSFHIYFIVHECLAMTNMPPSPLKSCHISAQHPSAHRRRWIAPNSSTYMQHLPYITTYSREV